MTQFSDPRNFSSRHDQVLRPPALEFFFLSSATPSHVPCLLCPRLRFRTLRPSRIRTGGGGGNVVLAMETIAGRDGPSIVLERDDTLREGKDYEEALWPYVFC